MMYDRVYDKGKEKQCWGCGEKTRYAIIKHRNIDREIPVCTKCILSLHNDVASLIYWGWGEYLHYKD